MSGVVRLHNADKGGVKGKDGTDEPGVEVMEVLVIDDAEELGLTSG